ncbi:MAG: hypothetical protein K2N28_01350 [Muribaculaceae bacterium]|nr:hypothetical protein [Muribaculaceae bacterium]
MNKIAFIAVAVVAAWTGAAARTMYSVQPVADVELSGRVWNLTECEPVGAEFEYRVDEGDTARVWSPDKRFDFTHRGDSVMQTCAETRAYRALFSPGVVRQRGDGGGAAAFAVKGRVYQSGYIAGEGLAVADVPSRGTAIVNGGDTIGAWLHHDVVTISWTLTGDSLTAIGSVPDSLTMTTVIESYRVTGDGEPFPRALKRVERQMAGGRVVACDSSAWVLSYTPGIEAERANRAARSRRPGGHDNGPTDLNPDGSTPDIRVITGRDGVTVSSAADLDAKVVITDMIGRMYYEADISLSPGGAQVSTDGLPRGEYLLQVIPADGTPTVAVKLTR